MIIYKQFGIFVCLFLPVFVTYVPGAGFIFDANPFNRFLYPSLPISLLFLPILSFYNRFRYNFFSLLLLVFLSLLSYVIFYLSSLYRQYYYVLSLFLSFHIFFLFKFIGRNILIENKIFILSCVINIILFIKLLSDLLRGEFITSFFIIDNFQIYNYYDYFPFLYFLSFCFCVYFISDRKYVFSLIHLFSSFPVLFSHSRLFVFSIFFVILFSLFRLRRLNFSILFLGSIIVLFLSITLSVLCRHNVVEESMSTRLNHWFHFFRDFEPINLIFPFLNDYRMKLTWGSLHNEFIDLFSYFGFLIFIYLGFLFYIGRSVDFKVIFLSKMIIPFMILATFIQNNFTHLYSLVLFFSIFGYLQKDKTLTSSSNYSKVLGSF